MNISIEGILEIQGDRGVVYFHVTNLDDIQKLGAITLLRVCNLEPIKRINGLIDVRAERRDE